MDLHGMEAAMYLRKSRAEDGMDTAEILRRHRETLTELAEREGVRVAEIFQEIKSGESLYARPEMMRLLEAVEAGRFGAVLCMDIDRLSRGETRERGLIWSAFKASGTFIVTPSKVYDLAKESDELMTELRGLFANFELRQIKQRIRRGMTRAAKEGQHLAPAPYGYRKAVIDRRHTLEIYEPEARFVRMIFELYASGVGARAIANRLNDAGARPRRADVFTQTAILYILRNSAYIGAVTYATTHWERKGGKMRSIPRPESEWIRADGIHPAIVSAELFDECQRILKSRWRPACSDGTVKSPLAGLVVCGRCGKRMQKRLNGGYYYLRCDRQNCSTLANYDAVERAVIDGLRDILRGLEMEPDGESAAALEAAKARLAAARKSIAAEKRKKARLYGFLESGTYTEAMFRERMEALSVRLSALESRERDAAQEVETLSGRDAKKQAAGIRALLREYEGADAATKNAILRAVVDVIVYNRNGKEPFTIDIFLK